MDPQTLERLRQLYAAGVGPIGYTHGSDADAARIAANSELGRALQFRLTGAGGNAGANVGDWVSDASGWGSRQLNPDEVAGAGYEALLEAVGEANEVGNRAGYYGQFNPDGTLRDVTYREADDGGMTSGFFNKLMRSTTNPLVAAALIATAGAAGAGLFGGAAAGAGSAGSAAPAAAGGMSTIPGAGLTLPAGVAPGMTSMSGMSFMPGTLGATAGEMGLLGAGAAGAAAGAGAVAPVVQSAPSWTAPASAAPASVPAAGASAGGGILEAAKAAAPYAQLVGPAASLLAGAAQLGSLPQVPDAPRIPGAEAPPEARGYQAGVAPILDVLGRNQREGRNRTLLTGGRGVNMDSVRARGNSLLGL